MKILRSRFDLTRLGLELGLFFDTVKAMKDEADMLAAWLKQQDGVKKKGGPSWVQLGKALKEIGEVQLGDDIIKQYTRNSRSIAEKSYVRTKRSFREDSAQSPSKRIAIEPSQ